MQKRVKNIFNPNAAEPFRISRSRLENFIRCPRCFYLDRRLGIDQPPGYPFTLNNAVDYLLKKEFDLHRAAGTPHPLMKQYGIAAVPFLHPEIDRWRENFVGLQYWHRPTNFLVTGAVDDIWQNPAGDLIVVDYKATSTNDEITLESEYRQAYKRQIGIYQWLLRQLGYKVANTGYFVYANGRKDRQAFDGKLEFDVQIIAHKGDDQWVEPLLLEARKCLEGLLPPYSEHCDFCDYRRASQTVEN